MQIDERDRQPENAKSSMDTKCQSAWKVIVERDQHSAKQGRGSLSTSEGMQIDESEEQQQKALTCT
jgi:hypothetical protein